MGLFSRDKDDDRSLHDVLNDIGHDIYHRVAKLDKGHPDGQMKWPHSEDCDYLGDGKSNGGKGWW